MTCQINVKIIQITVQKKDINITYQSTLDKNPKQLVIDEDTFINYRMLKDKVYDEDTWNQILKEASLSIYLKKAINLISYKPRTTGEIKELLKASLDEELTALIIDKLNAMNLLDDSRYVTSFVDDYRHNLKGPILIKYKLEQKGVADNMINDAIACYTDQEQHLNILTIIEKNQERLSTYPINKQKQLITDKLLRDGYSYSVIQRCLDEYEYTSSHHERMHQDYQKIIQTTQEKNKVIQKMMNKGYSYQEIKALMRE